MNWFNSVDATYWTDLRELNETTFVRFDAKLEQRIAQLRGEVVAELSKLRGDTTAAIAQAQSATVRWMFIFWAPTALAVVALLLRR